VCCSVVQCVAVCCRLEKEIPRVHPGVQCVAVCYSALQCVAVCSSVLLPRDGRVYIGSWF